MSGKSAARRRAALAAEFSSVRAEWAEAQDAGSRDARRHYRAAWTLAVEILRLAPKARGEWRVPGEVAVFIAEQMENAIANKESLLPLLRRRGAPAGGTRLRLAKEAAAAYVAAAKAGLIAVTDPHAVVCDAYRIVRRTALAWCREHPVDTAQLYPRRPPDARARVIAMEMRKLAAWFRTQPRHGFGG